MSGLDAVAGAVYAAAINHDVAVNHELASSGDGRGQAKAKDYVVQALLKEAEQDEAGGIAGGLSFDEKVSKLLFANAVVISKLLLLIELLFIFAEALAAFAVLSRWVGATIRDLAGQARKVGAEAAGDS